MKSTKVDSLLLLAVMSQLKEDTMNATTLFLINKFFELVVTAEEELDEFGIRYSFEYGDDDQEWVLVLTENEAFLIDDTGFKNPVKSYRNFASLIGHKL